MHNKKVIDDLVFRGLLPVAFANSKIIKIEVESNQNKFISEIMVNKRYKQKELSESSVQILISKIYDLY